MTLPGSVLPGPFPIAARKTYGHVSDGMIASAKELGLGDEHSGILRLVELGVDAPVGTDAIALLGLDDVAIDINVTPDRGYALSMRGVAREYSHATGAAFRDPGLRAADEVAPGTGFPIVVDDQAPIRGRVGASEFVARVVRDVDPTKPTPEWMIARLTLAGIRSLGILIDITNYVMLELGQPIHGYDLDKLSGGITVRRATPGEKIETLDGKVRTLDPEDLLITDESGPIGLAGVMGGGPTEMGPATRNVLIEAAAFDPVTIARTARRHKLPSEASRRFERGVDPAMPLVASRLVADLMVEYAGGTFDAELGGSLGAVIERTRIALPGRLRRGHHRRRLHAASRSPGALRLIGCDLDERPEGWIVTAPTWRPDLTDKWTLAEEVARIEGYDRIPSVLPLPPSGRGLTAAQQGRRRVANALAAAGFVETPSFAFTTEEQNDLHGSASGGHLPSVKLANPLDGQAPFLRRSLIPGLLEVAHRNVSRGFTDLALFESGVVFLPNPGVAYGTSFIPPLAVRPDAATLAALDASIPPQRRHVAVLLAGNAVAKQPGTAAVARGRGGCARRRPHDRGRGRRDDRGRAGRACRAASGTHRRALGRVDRGRLRRRAPSGRRRGRGPSRPRDRGRTRPRPRPLARGAEVRRRRRCRDTRRRRRTCRSSSAPMFPRPRCAQSLVEGAGDLLESLRLVDDYRGPGVTDGAKSLTFALRFRAPDRTLTAAEATEAKLAGRRRRREAFRSDPPRVIRRRRDSPPSGGEAMRALR